MVPEDQGLQATSRSTVPIPPKEQKINPGLSKTIFEKQRKKGNEKTLRIKKEQKECISKFERFSQSSP